MIHTYTHEDVVCVEGIVKRRGRDSSIYVFLTDGMLIDTGPKMIEESLVPFYQSSSFESVVLTHSHEDHSGTAAWIDQNLHVPIYIHDKSVAFCAQKPDYPQYRRLTWGIREPFLAHPLKKSFHSRTLDWKVLETPGHAHDHIALIHEKTGRLFAGDLFLGVKTKVILREESIPTLLSSLRLVLSHDFQALYCAHAGYIASGKAMLQKKLDHLENLSGEILLLHGKGMDADEINRTLFPVHFPIIEASEGEFDSLHIVTSVLAGHEQLESCTER
ncbi:MBL fold metallo-hydrolase [Brevibacillus choshinensis]|uniref:MBL fold metallo-hydrolase n=1 Tax=Brevibacillus choshinensis TaxID=54911 RepID=A0ABX7FU40_BRECH|nr:MBL fold metallo-hydrolase [Brevibacillus choshinensis]QRG69084.1 MBL fold metallo-hydrolase [Brevibacillus choshinensis]